MGKTLKFPKRKKFVTGDEKTASSSAETGEEISEEEHNQRLDMLKSLGLVK